MVEEDAGGRGGAKGMIHRREGRGRGIGFSQRHTNDQTKIYFFLFFSFAAGFMHDIYILIHTYIYMCAKRGNAIIFEFFGSTSIYRECT